MRAARIRIDRLVVRVPHDLGPRARTLGPLIAEQLAQTDWQASSRMEHVRVEGVCVQSTWSNMSIAAAVARATAARTGRGEV